MEPEQEEQPEEEFGSRRNARETAEALAEALAAKQQADVCLHAARIAIASLNVDWANFVEKGVAALPVPKKAKKAAAARAKQQAAAAAAEEAAAEVTVVAEALATTPAKAEPVPLKAAPTLPETPPRNQVVVGLQLTPTAAGGVSPSAVELGPGAEQAISGVLLAG